MNYTMDVTFVYYDFPYDYDKNTPMDLDDFDSHRASFSGNSTADALLRGLSSFGYVDYEKYIRNNDDNELIIEDILDFVDLKDGCVNGDEKDFIAYIEDELGGYIFEDERGLSKWKATFRIGG